MHAAVRAVALPQQCPLGLQYLPGQETLWISLRHFAGRPHNFSAELLDAIQFQFDEMAVAHWCWNEDGVGAPIRYAVMTSDHPSYFSVGGDLAFFRRCVEHRDAETLRGYSLQCLDVISRWAMAGADVETVAVVQGRALGGGFETVLGANYIVAEEQAEFGFPEVLFGLFPVSGGMALLARRIGIHRAERMMAEGRLYSAAELLEMGLVDEVCAQGEGPTTANAYIKRHRGVGQRARMMLRRAKLRMSPLDLNEMRQVVDEWVETALALTPKEIRVMDALIGMQRKGFS
jgi:DSF synthase